MTYAKLDLSALTLANETLTSSAELIMKHFIMGGKFADFHAVIPDIKFTREVGLLGELGTIGKARQSCNGTPEVVTSTADLKTWTQYNWEIFLEICFSDLNTTIARYDLKNGPEKGNLEGTPYFNTLMYLVEKALNKLLWRVWLMDTAAAHSDDSPAGVITPTVDLTHMTLANGYWKQIYAIVAGDANRLETIAANSEATKALQFSALTPTLAYGYLESLTYDCNPTLKQIDKSEIWAGCTRSLFDKAAKYLQGLGISETYLNLVNGIQTLKVNGYEFTALDIWDEQIQAYEDNGTSYNKPHRALLTTKDNILFGVPSGQIIESIDAFYEIKPQLEYIRATDDFSPLILENAMIQVAY